MSDISRRSLLAAGAMTASLAHAKKNPRPEKPIGVQLYTVRNVLPKDPDATLKAIAGIGYPEVALRIDGNASRDTKA